MILLQSPLFRGSISIHFRKLYEYIEGLLKTLPMNQGRKRLTNSLEGRIPIQNIFNGLKPTKIQLHKY